MITSPTDISPIWPSFGAAALTSLCHHSLHRFSRAHHEFRGRAVTFCLLPMPYPVTHGKRRPGATNGPREEAAERGQGAQREGGEGTGLERGGQNEGDRRRERRELSTRFVFSASERHLRDTIILLTFSRLGVSRTGREQTYFAPFLSSSRGSRCIHTFTRVRGCVPARSSLYLLVTGS